MKGKRSPKSPSIPLGDALTKIEKIFSAAKRAEIDRDMAAQTLGYGGVNGASAKVLGSLAEYGLLEKASGGGVRVSELAIECLHPADEQSLRKSLILCCKNSQVLASLMESYSDCDEAVVKGYLIRERHNPESAARTSRVFVETIDYLRAFNCFPDQTESDQEKEGQVVNSVATGSPEKAQVQAEPVARGVDYVRVPLDIADALIPKGITSEDYDLLISALQLYRRKIVFEPSDEEDNEICII